MLDICKMCFFCAGRWPGQLAGGRTVVGNSGVCRRVGGLVVLTMSTPSREAKDSGSVWIRGRKCSFLPSFIDFIRSFISFFSVTSLISFISCHSFHFMSFHVMSFHVISLLLFPFISFSSFISFIHLFIHSFNQSINQFN